MDWVTYATFGLAAILAALKLGDKLGWLRARVSASETRQVRVTDYAAQLYEVRSDLRAHLVAAAAQDKRLDELVRHLDSPPFIDGIQAGLGRIEAELHAVEMRIEKRLDRLERRAGLNGGS